VVAFCAVAGAARADVFCGLRLVQCFYLAPPGCGYLLLRVGKAHSLRARDDRAVSVHRPVFCRLVFPLPGPGSVAHPCVAHCSGHRPISHRLSDFSIAVRLDAAGRDRMAGNAFRPPQFARSAVQSLSLAAHQPALDPVAGLRPQHTRAALAVGPGGVLVRLDRSLDAAHLSTPCH
jgi:hypothetical protein